MSLDGASNNTPIADNGDLFRTSDTKDKPVLVIKDLDDQKAYDDIVKYFKERINVDMPLGMRPGDMKKIDDFIQNMVFKLFNVKSMAELRSILGATSFKDAYDKKVKEHIVIPEGLSVTVFSLSINSANAGDMVDTIATQALTMLGYDPLRGAYTMQSDARGALQELLKLPPQLMGKVIKSMYEQLPADNADRGALLRKMLLEVPELGAEDKKNIFKALRYLDAQEPDSVEKILSSRNSKEATKIALIIEGIRLVKTGMTKIKEDMHKIRKISQDEVKDMNADEIERSRQGYMDAIESIRRAATAMLEAFPGATPEEQVHIEQKYNKLMRELDRMTMEVDRTFSKFLHKNYAAESYSDETKRTALSTQEDLKRTIRRAHVKMVIAVKDLNKNILQKGKDDLASEKRPVCFGLVLDEDVLSAAIQSSDMLLKSGDAGALEGKAAIAEYRGTRSDLQMLALETSWKYKDVLLGGEVLKDRTEETVGRYAGIAGRYMSTIWEQIKDHAQSTVSKVLTENRKYFAWLDKYVEKRKKAQKEEDKKELAEKTEELNELIAETEQLGDSPVRKSMRELAKEELIRKKLAADTMEEKAS